MWRTFITILSVVILVILGVGHKKDTEVSIFDINRSQGLISINRETLDEESASPKEAIEEKLEIAAYIEPGTNLLDIEFYGIVTAYNLVPEQTDFDYCVGASGDDLCGRTDVIACSRRFSLGTNFEINDRVYVCFDRTAKKFDCSFGYECEEERWDISFDQDIEAAKKFGKQYLKIIELKIDR